MHKTYAVDLIAMEEELEEMDAERQRIENLSPIMRRLKAGRASELDNRMASLRWKILTAKEEVFADPTSVKIYEAEMEKKRKKELEALVEDEKEPDPSD